MTVVLVILVKFTVYAYVFPDRHRPLTMPASVGGLAKADAGSADLPSYSEMISKEAGGAASAAAIYGGLTPDRTVVVGATRARVSKSDSAMPKTGLTKVGKVTCVQDTSGSKSVALSICWRFGWRLTVMAFSAPNPSDPYGTAVSAVNDVWDAQ